MGIAAKTAQRSGRAQGKIAKPVPGAPGSGGILPAARLGSTSVLSGTSTDLALPTTPSPLPTRSSSSVSVGRRRRISFSNGTPGPSTPDSGGRGGGSRGSGGDGGSVGGGSADGGSRRVTAKATSRATAASTTPFGRATASHRSRLIGAASSRPAAQALAAATTGRGDVAVEDNCYGRGAQKQRGLPARQRASEKSTADATFAATTAAIATRINRDDVTDDGSPSDASTPSVRAELRQAKQVLDGAGGYGGVRKNSMAPTSAGDWSEAGSWNGGQDKHAPAWR